MSQKKPIAAFINSEPWFDIGTPKNFYLAHLELLKKTPGNLFEKLELKKRFKKMGLSPLRKIVNENAIFLSHPLKLDEKLIKHKNLISCGPVNLPKVCTLENVLLLENATINEGEKISQMIIGKDFRLSV